MLKKHFPETSLASKQFPEFSRTISKITLEKKHECDLSQKCFSAYLAYGDRAHIHVLG